MRDPKQTKRSKRGGGSSMRVSSLTRRALLASAIALVAGPAVDAEEAKKTEMRMLPPLPVEQVIQQVANHDVQLNPFCEPRFRPINNVQLASGDSPKVRLKESNNAVELQPIQPGMPIPVRPQALRIDPVAEPDVQVNPLLMSEHNEHNPDLVDTGVTSMANERLEELELTRRGQELAPAVRVVPSSVQPSSVQPSSARATADRPTPVAAQPSSALMIPAVPAAIPPAPPTVAPNKVATATDLQASQPNLNPVSAPVAVAAPIADALAVDPTELMAQAEKEVAKAGPVQVAAPVQSNLALAPAGTVKAAPASSGPVPTVAEPVSQPKLANGPVVAPEMPTPKSVLAPAPQETQAVAEQKQKPIHEPVVVAEAPKPEPVFFTISDSSSEEDLAATSPSDIPVAKSPEPPALGVVVAKPFLPDAESSEKASDRTGLKPLKASPASSRLTKSDGPSKLRKLEGSGKSVIYHSNARPSASSQSPSSMLSKKRFRPPVAVDAPPVAITKTAKAQPTVKPALQNPIVAAKVQVTKQAKPSLTKLRMTRAQVRSLTIGGHVRRINVANKNVCQAIATGPNQVKLIGTGYGVTRLVVWADASSRSPTRIRTFEIHVEDAVEATGNSSIAEKTEMLNRSIEQAFPYAEISVQRYQDRLVVSGQCDTETEAKKIIRMVRKTCIVPVRDEIKVR